MDFPLICHPSVHITICVQLCLKAVLPPVFLLFPHFSGVSTELIIHREKVLALHSWDQTDLPLHFALTLFSTFNPMCTPYINSTCNL